MTVKESFESSREEICQEILFTFSRGLTTVSVSGVIFLQGYKAQQSSVAGRRHAWQMTPSASDSSNVRTFFFHAQTETEKKRWVTVC